MFKLQHLKNMQWLELDLEKGGFYSCIEDYLKKVSFSFLRTCSEEKQDASYLEVQGIRRKDPAEQHDQTRLLVRTSP